MHDCLIAFGSNEGNSNEVFEQAVKQVSEIPDVKLLATSKPLQTQPVGGPDDQNAYLNAAIRIQSNLEPAGLHRQLVRIETELGRERRVRWGARKIDLDLLLCGVVEIQTKTLTLPHPRMSFRRFVIQPANEIASDMVHATSGQTIGQLLQALNQREDRVLLVSAEAEFVEHEKMILRLMPTGWKFEAVSQLAVLNRYKDNAKKDIAKNDLAKLVCYVANPIDEAAPPSEDSGREPDRLFQAAVSFPGPTLRLDRDLKKSEIEVKAAFEAIVPFQ